MAHKKKRSDGRYVATLMDGGTRHYFYSSVSKADAERKKQEYMAAVTEQEKHPEIRSGVTYNEWRETWLSSYKATLAANSIALYTSVSANIGRFVLDSGRTIGETPMKDFLPLHIAKYVVSLEGKSRSTISINKIVLNDLFSTAEDNGIVAANPCKKMPKVNGTYGGHHALTREEIALITNNYQLHRHGTMFLFLLYTGCRRGEAFAMTWDRIDFEHDTIRIEESHDSKHGITKGPKSSAGYRTVPLLPPLRRALWSIRKESGLVFPMPDGGYFTDGYATSALLSFQNFLERCLNGVPRPETGRGFRRDLWEAAHGWRELEAFNYHDLRDTYCTCFLFDAGVDVKTASVLMGHSSTDITLNIYTKLSEERKSDSIGKMVNFCESLNCGQTVVRAVF